MTLLDVLFVVSAFLFGFVVREFLLGYFRKKGENLATNRTLQESRPCRRPRSIDSTN